MEVVIGTASNMILVYKDSLISTGAVVLIVKNNISDQKSTQEINYST